MWSEALNSHSLRSGGSVGRTENGEDFTLKTVAPTRVKTHRRTLLWWKQLCPKSVHSRSLLMQTGLVNPQFPFSNTRVTNFLTAAKRAKHFLHLLSSTSQNITDRAVTSACAALGLFLKVMAILRSAEEPRKLARVFWLGPCRSSRMSPSLRNTSFIVGTCTETISGLFCGPIFWTSVELTFAIGLRTLANLRMPFLRIVWSIRTYQEKCWWDYNPPLSLRL